MLDWLEQLVKNFEFLFWVLIVLGSSIASVLKTRSERKRSQQGRGARPAKTQAGPAPPPLPPPPVPPPPAPAPAPAAERPTPQEALRRWRELLEEGEVEIEIGGTEPPEPWQGAPEGSTVLSAAPPPPARSLEVAPPLESAEQLQVGGLEARRLDGSLGDSYFDGVEDRFQSADIGSLSRQLEEADLAGLEPSAAAAAAAPHPAWRVPGSWRDAVIWREVLGSTRALRQDDLPGLGPGP